MPRRNLICTSIRRTHRRFRSPSLPNQRVTSRIQNEALGGHTVFGRSTRSEPKNGGTNGAERSCDRRGRDSFEDFRVTEDVASILDDLAPLITEAVFGGENGELQRTCPRRSA